MKVLHVCYSDNVGGAFIGAHRLHSCMISQGVDSKLLVIKKRTNDPNVLAVPARLNLLNFINRNLSKLVIALQRNRGDEFQSLNLFPSLLDGVINDIDADIVQFHWIGSNTIGIKELQNIQKPIVWKLPDMWAFCGSEHYTDHEDRYIEGYSAENKPSSHSGIDLDRFCWELKRECWGHLNLTIVCPSQWLSQCASKSYLLRNKEIHNIPNPIDTAIFKPAEDVSAIKEKYQLPKDKRIILFAALAKKTYKRKGFHHFEECLAEYGSRVDASSCVVVLLGPYTGIETIHGITTICLGVIESPFEMSSLYAIADVTVIPTQADSTPNVIKESMTCGTPCISFDASGVMEMIEHKSNGYLAKMDDAKELADGLEWVLSQKGSQIRANARESALRLHGHEPIVRRYLDLYKAILAAKHVE